MPRYVKHTKEELIVEEKQSIEEYKNGTYAQYLADPVKYAEGKSENHVKYVSEDFPKKLEMNDEEIYQYAFKSDYGYGTLIQRSQFINCGNEDNTAATPVVPYVYFGWKVLIVHFIMFIWNLGVNTLLVLYFANQNYRRIDLSKSSTFNWEGVGASQWILSIPLLLAPFVIYFPLDLVGYPEAGLALIAVIGMIFIISREFWLNKLVKRFQEKRYLIAEGFRNK
jgi:hypothetical protein